MNIEEFLNRDKNPVEDTVPTEEEDAQYDEAENLDVQKAVVEELAADKAKLDEELVSLRSDISVKNGQIKAQNAMMTSLNDEIKSLRGKIAELETRLAEEQERHFDEQARNPNALALLDRDVELPDRFPGETRDHVLEVIREAREMAEKDGRIRRAQVLEGVLLANEPNGELASRRAELETLFNENSNVINGIVLEKLTKLGISHKNGEEYLLPAEIIKRTY